MRATEPLGSRIGAAGQGPGGGCLRQRPFVRSRFRAPWRRVSVLGSLLAGLSAQLMVSGPAAAARQEPARDVADLSIEELLRESVSLASRKETSVLRTPAAISVLTGDDIRRLGITSLPEALRFVAGMNVARINAHAWAISARGFQGLLSDKVLVMIDGRAIYQFQSPGVFWEDNDILLENVERIEVVRGPGATLWGANAVNGVVNVVTRHAEDTQGPLVMVAAGSEERVATSLRYGGSLNPDLHYRVFAKYFDRDGLVDTAGEDAPYGWQGLRGGFRLDWSPPTADTLRVDGSFFASDTAGTIDHFQLTPPFGTTEEVVTRNYNGHLMGRWNRDFSATSQLSVQGALAHSDHPLIGRPGSDDVADLELQHRFAPHAGHDVVWGLGYRYRRGEMGLTQDRVTRVEQHLYTAFVQDEFAVVPDRWQLSVGTKVEHHEFTGFELQPALRLLWTPDDRQALWSSISRAVRTPDPFENGANLDFGVIPPGNSGLPVQLRVIGKPDIVSETVIAYELGYRNEPTAQVGFDLALFYNQYDDLIAIVPGPVAFEPQPAPHLVLPVESRNVPGGGSYGAELAVSWQATRRWRLAGDYAWHRLSFDFPQLEFEHPENQARLRSYLTLPGGWELNGALAYTDRLRTQRVDSYLRGDLGLLWHRDDLEIGLWGQNLLAPRHAEFENFTSGFRGEVPRSWVLRFTWKR
jgi:iron complex outermembrane recepter protein